MAKKVIFFIILIAVFSFCWKLGLSYFEPQVSTAIAVGQVSYDSTQAQAAMRSYQQIQNLLYGVPALFTLVMFAIFFGRDLLMIGKKAKEEVAKEIKN
jgi:hypothetical protein